jgi:hypothetical protein
MKKPILASIVFLAFVLTASAQYPAPGTRSFSFGISGLANIGVTPNASRAGNILFRKYKSDKMAMRYSLGFGLADNGNSYVSQTGMATYNDNLYFNLNLGIGFQHNLIQLKDLGTSRLLVYCGADFTLGGTYLKNKQTNNFILDPTRIPGSLYGDYDRSTTTTVTPLRVGVFPLIGAQYFLRDNISLGAEFFDGLIAGFLQKETAVYEDVRGGIKTTGPTYNVLANGFTLQDNLGGVLMVSVYF